VQLFETAGLDQHIALQRSDRLVVGLETRLEPRSQRVEVAAEDPHGVVEVSAELADLPRVLAHRLLLPAVRHRPQQRDQRRRARGDDALIDTELDEPRVLLERRAGLSAAGRVGKAEQSGFCKAACKFAPKTPAIIPAIV